MNDTEHSDFMRSAVETARQGIDRGQTPFGACLVKENVMVARAHNTVWQDTDITAHAEIQAIRRGCRQLSTVDLSGCVMYSTCEPCPMCFSACHWARVGRIVYGASISDAAEAGFNEMPLSNTEMKERGESPIAVTSGILREECVRLFEQWAGRSDRRNY